MSICYLTDGDGSETTGTMSHPETQALGHLSFGSQFLPSNVQDNWIQESGKSYLAGRSATLGVSGEALLPAWCVSSDQTVLKIALLSRDIRGLTRVCQNIVISRWKVAS